MKFIDLIFIVFIIIFISGCNKETEKNDIKQNISQNSATTVNSQIDKTFKDSNKLDEVNSYSKIKNEKSNTITDNNKNNQENLTSQENKIIYPKITFIELGSVNCIPCKKMQPIMKSIENKYGEQIKIIFYDVMKEINKAKSKEYGINLIPTQIFLDVNGKEIHRHVGFYPESEIEKFLVSKGLKSIIID